MEDAPEPGTLLDFKPVPFTRVGLDGGTPTLQRRFIAPLAGPGPIGAATHEECWAAITAARRAVERPDGPHTPSPMIGHTRGGGTRLVPPYARPLRLSSAFVGDGQPVIAARIGVVADPRPDEHGAVMDEPDVDL